MPVPTAVLIEDNNAVSETLCAALRPLYHLLKTGSGKKGLNLIKTKHPELIILDLNLPDISGLKVCLETRKLGVKVPIIVLSGDGRLATKLQLFSAGADDYMVKPFSLGELEARLRAMSRRNNMYKQLLANPRTSSLVLDRNSQSVSRDGGRSINLRHKEYAILEFLIKHAGQVVSRDHLASNVWKGIQRPWSNSVDVHVKYLRDKIDKPFEKRLISTIHGTGYRLDDA